MFTDVSHHHTSCTLRPCHVLTCVCCTLKMALLWPTETLHVSVPHSCSNCLSLSAALPLYLCTVVLLCCSPDNYTQTTTAVRRPNIVEGKEADSGAVKVKILQDGMGDMELHITNLLQGRAVMGTCGTGRATIAVCQQFIVLHTLPLVPQFCLFPFLPKGPHTQYRAPYTVKCPIHRKGHHTL
jgi:hypothetical protein